MAGGDQAPRHFDHTRATQHLARGVVVQGHRFEAALLARDPDQHPRVLGRGTAQRYRQCCGDAQRRHDASPLPTARSWRRSFPITSCRQAGWCFTQPQLSHGMCLHPSVRRGGGGLDRPHAAHWAPPAGLQLKTWPGIKPEVKRQFAGLSVWVAALYAPSVGWSTFTWAHQKRGNPRFQRIDIKGARKPTRMNRCGLRTAVAISGPK